MILKFGLANLLMIWVAAAAGAAQAIPAPPQNGGGAEFVIDAKLLEIDRLSLNSPGASTPAGSTRMNPSYVISIPDSVAQSLAGGPRTRVLHNLQVTMVSGKPAQLHIGSRVATGTPPAEFLDIGFDFEVTSRKAPNRETLRVGAQVQIRRGNNTAGEIAQPIFKSSPIQHEIGIVEGETIVIGGFITDSEALVLTDVPALKSSPLLSYLFSSQGQPPNVSEVVLMLVPRMGKAPVPTTSLRPGASTEARTITAADRVPSQTAPKPLPESAKGLYTVQVGAFQSLATAQVLQGRLEKQHSDVFIQTIPGEPPLYRVRVGRVPDLPAARRLETQLRREGFQPVVASME